MKSSTGYVVAFVLAMAVAVGLLVKARTSASVPFAASAGPARATLTGQGIALYDGGALQGLVNTGVVPPSFTNVSMSPGECMTACTKHGGFNCLNACRARSLPGP